MSRVLVVDDERPVAAALSRILRRAGHEVELAASGAEALQRLAGFAPDLLISDYRMPQMSGVELLDEVARRLPGCKRVLISGEAELRSFGGTAPPHAVLAKPWDNEALLAAVQALLEPG